jgi:hypothetical protein
MDDDNAGTRRDTQGARKRSGITFLDDAVGTILNGLIALRGSVGFGLTCVLVLGEARKCRSEQESCKSELGGLSVKPHGLVPPASIMFCLPRSGNAPQVKWRSTLDQQKIKCFVLNTFG